MDGEQAAGLEVHVDANNFFFSHVFRRTFKILSDVEYVCVSKCTGQPKCITLSFVFFCVDVQLVLILQPAFDSRHVLQESYKGRSKLRRSSSLYLLWDMPLWQRHVSCLLPPPTTTHGHITRVSLAIKNLWFSWLYYILLLGPFGGSQF
jgi:hypothetical protein